MSDRPPTWPPKIGDVYQHEAEGEPRRGTVEAVCGDHIVGLEDGTLRIRRRGSLVAP